MDTFWYDYVPPPFEAVAFTVHIFVLGVMQFSSQQDNFKTAFFVLYKSNGLIAAVEKLQEWQ